MRKKRENLWDRIVNYFYRTWKIKLIALAMILIGGLTIRIGFDATAFIFILVIALPMLFLDDKE